MNGLLIPGLMDDRVVARGVVLLIPDSWELEGYGLNQCASFCLLLVLETDKAWGELGIIAFS